MKINLKTETHFTHGDERVLLTSSGGWISIVCLVLSLPLVSAGLIYFERLWGDISLLGKKDAGHTPLAPAPVKKARVLALWIESTS